MKKLYTTIATPEYLIRSPKGDHFDIFKRRENAIKAAIKMAFEYPGATFVVIKRVFMKEKQVFSFKFDAEFDFDDFKTVHQSILEASSSKLEKARFWRKKGVDDE